MQKQPFTPVDTYVHLDANGRADQLAGGPAFWSQSPEQLALIGNGWLVSEYTFDADWPNWEMHPAADEYVYVVAGAVDLHLQLPDDTVHCMPLMAPCAVVVPAGVWHTAKVATTCRMLHITMGRGTEVRPV